MEWIRGDTIGSGSFGTVSLAIPTSKNHSSPIVVKSCVSSSSNSLENEKLILSQLGNNHPNIIRLLGDSLTTENHTLFYNLFLEYAKNGSLSDHLGISGGKFNFSDVKKFTKSILEGLCYIHEKGFVHCDIKLQNILLFSSGVAKIADFGLAKRVSDKTGTRLRGTPLYMSPEIIAGGVVESPADIWALGCAVVEMVSGKPAWNFSPESDVSALLYRIGVAGESPVIPESMCPHGRDFLEKCFVKDPSQRWTARMLLTHPFVSGLEDSIQLDSLKQAPASPRCPFEFPDWESTEESGSSSSSSLNSSRSFDWVKFSQRSETLNLSSISSRFENLVSDRDVFDWVDSDSWVTVW